MFVHDYMKSVSYHALQTVLLLDYVNAEFKTLVRPHRINIPLPRTCFGRVIHEIQYFSFLKLSFFTF